MFKSKEREYTRKYYMNNKNKFAASNAKYYQKNAEKLKEKRRKRYIKQSAELWSCPVCCGKKIKVVSVKAHLKSAKHARAVAEKNKPKIDKEKELERVRAEEDRIYKIMVRNQEAAAKLAEEKRIAELKYIEEHEQELKKEAVNIISEEAKKIADTKLVRLNKKLNELPEDDSRRMSILVQIEVIKADPHAFTEDCDFDNHTAVPAKKLKDFEEIGEFNDVSVLEAFGL